jgi:hypothetical protein
MTEFSAVWAYNPKSVNELTYRQFNYGVLMSLSSQLARWLHKRLSHNYTNASFMDAYEVLFSSIQRDSGLLPDNRRTNDNLKASRSAFDELCASQVLFSWERLDERRERRKIIDIKYSLQAHADFIKDVKAANARAKDSRSSLSDAPVHKSLPGGR